MGLLKIKPNIHYHIDFFKTLSAKKNKIQFLHLKLYPILDIIFQRAISCNPCGRFVPVHVQVMK